MKNDKTWCVYIHTSPNGKKYIGITSAKPKSRWGASGAGYKTQKLFYRAIQKYGWDNFLHEVIKGELTEEDAKALEIELISLYESNNPKFGYNVSSGGDNSTKGVYNLKSMSKPIYQYDLDGNFVAKYPSSMEAERVTGIPNSNICACCKGKHAYAIGFQWKYYKRKQISPIPEERRSINYKGTNLHKKRVYQYTLDGTYIRRYDSLSSASNITGIDFRTISECCLGRKDSCRGYQWTYTYVPRMKKLDKKHRIKERRVINLLDTLGNVLQTYDSIVDASRNLNIPGTDICKVCRGKLKSTRGHRFCYAS